MDSKYLLATKLALRLLALRFALRGARRAIAIPRARREALNEKSKREIYFDSRCHAPILFKKMNDTFNTS